mmetsp:Transcript_29019/g.62436  ORF Transcript_29019/g.62436 Transcript_29019/m.62436 type:complete len:335 (-) Transcript_29019:168-1172(-)
MDASTSGSACRWRWQWRWRRRCGLAARGQPPPETQALGGRAALLHVSTEALRTLEKRSEEVCTTTGLGLHGAGLRVGGRLGGEGETEGLGGGGLGLPREIVTPLGESRLDLVAVLLEVVARLARGGLREATKLRDELPIELHLLLALAPEPPHEHRRAWADVSDGEAVDAHELLGYHLLAHADGGEGVEGAHEVGDEHCLHRIAAVASDGRLVCFSAAALCARQARRRRRARRGGRLLLLTLTREHLHLGVVLESRHSELALGSLKDDHIAFWRAFLLALRLQLLRNRVEHRRGGDVLDVHTLAASSCSVAHLPAAAPPAPVLAWVVVAHRCWR